MMKNYIKVAWRNINKKKGFTLINIFGLSVGLGCCVVIILFVIHELAYDSQHPDHQRIYRINQYRISPTGEYPLASTPGPLITAIKNDLPGVEQAFRMVPPYENADHVLVVQNEKRFFEKKIFFADPEILEVFHIPFIAGNSYQALSRPNTVLINRDMAVKYFGIENPMGKTIKMEFDYDLGPNRVKLEDFEIIGVIDPPPSNTHVKYHMLVSMATLKNNLPDFEQDWTNPKCKYSYVKLRPDTDPGQFENRLQIYARELAGIFKTKFNFDLGEVHFLLQPITGIHMHPQKYNEPEPGGNWLYVYIYALIAGLVLLIGCMNFINLSTALSTTRAREVGIRKVMGAGRIQLIWQYLVEAKIITLISFIGAVALAQLLLPLFNRMAGTGLTLADLNSPVVIISLFSLFLVVSISSEIFPAFIMTGFKPVTIFQGKFKYHLKGTFMQKFLVAGQFAITIFLIICTISVLRQLNFMRGRALGFDKEQKLILRVKSNLGHLRRDFAAIESAFLQHPEITGAAISSSVPGDDNKSSYLMWKEGAHRKTGVRLKAITVGPDFVPLYGLRLVTGRAFRKDLESDVKGAFMINETGLKFLQVNSPEEALGKRYTAHYHLETKAIIGVLKDFHLRGMQEKIEPLVLDIEPSLFNTLTLQINIDKIDGVMGFVRDTWKQHFPGVPLEYSFLDDDFDRVYRYEEQMGKLLRIIALLGIIIACLGLSGLAAFVSWKRQKEIGIRRVLGASTGNILTILSGKFILMVLVSIVIASPLAYLALNKWLESFAYRAPLGTDIFLVAAGVALILAFGAVAFQGLLATKRNPVESLRYE